MGWNTKKNNAKDKALDQKLMEGQQALLDAAAATSKLAQSITNSLLIRLDDIISQFENTAKILKDALIICNQDGYIQSFNPAAENMFGVIAEDAIRKSISDFFVKADGETLTTIELWDLLQNDIDNDVYGLKNGNHFNIQVTFSSLERKDGSTVMLLLIHDTSALELALFKKNEVTVHYQTLFNCSMDGIAVITENLDLVAVNPAMSKLFGHTPEALMGKPLTVIISPKDHDKISNGSLEDIHINVDGVNKQGKIIHLIMVFTKIFWESCDAFIVTIRDISQLRRLENMVSLKRDNGIDMVCCFDPEYRITFANQTFAASVGTKRTELIGADIRQLVDPDTCAKLENLNLSPIAPVKRSQIKIVDANGNESIQDWIDHATFNEEGKPVEFQRVGRDIGDVIKTISK